MTQKSEARKARDAQAKQYEQMKKTNNCWDELQQLATKCADMMVTTNSHLAEIYKTPGLVNFLPNANEVKTMLRGLSTDLLSFREELSRIYAAHNTRTGGFKDENDFAESISVYEQYVAFQTRYESVVSPTVQYLLEQAAIAEQNIYNAVQITQQTDEEKAKAELVDPNVVSDAVVKA